MNILHGGDTLQTLSLQEEPHLKAPSQNSGKNNDRRQGEGGSDSLSFEQQLRPGADNQERYHEPARECYDVSSLYRDPEGGALGYD